MNFDFPTPSSTKNSQFTPKQLVKLANQQPNIRIPIPTVNRVIEAIKNNRVHDIEKLEWIYCIYAKQKWDEKNPHISIETSELIWKVAIHNEWLQHQMLWYFGLYCGGQKNKLATSLAQTFYVLANSDLVNQLLPVKVMQAVINNNSGLELAKIACEENLSPKEFLNHIKNYLPDGIPQLNQFSEYISQHFCNINSPNKQQVNWLLRCFGDMSSEIQINAVNHLLINVPKNFAINHPQLIKWLRENYFNNSKWNQLLKEAQDKLREWIGAVNYGDFQNLVDLILQEIKLKDWEKNQLIKRRNFWANHSNYFQELRILLPQSSLNAIGNKYRGNVDLLEDDGSDTTEVCIFNFGEWIVVEFFRGRGSEMRLFPNNDINKKNFFSKKTLSVKRIRCLGGHKHDHVFLWQYYCREWLKNKGISINPGIKPYNRPTVQQMQERQIKLEQWKDEIEKLELEAKDYCNDNDFPIT